MFLRRRGRPENAAAAAALGALVREIAGLGPEAGVSVSEIHCGHTVCGGVETVILLMRPGRPTEALKIARPMSAVTREDLAEALKKPFTGSEPASPFIASPA